MATSQFRRLTSPPAECETYLRMVEKLPFISFEPPFSDFIVVHRGADLCSALPAQFGVSRARLPADTQLYATGTLADLTFDDGTALMSGVARIDGRVVLGPKKLTADTIVPNTLIGQCVVFRRTGTVLEIFTDFLGMVPLYYAFFGETFLCSNRVHLIAIATKALGHRPALDFDYVASTIFIDSIWCTQIGTQHLPIEGVRILRPGETIRVRKRRAKVAKAPAIERRALEPDEYHALIDAGASEVAANISAAIDVAGPDPLVADITGGRDSRVILAAIVALGKAESVRFATSETPGDPADVEIASGLLALFGGRFIDVPRGPTDAVDPDYVLHLHRSGFFGLYHDMLLPLARPRNQATSPWVGVGGGCGELYRDFWQKIVGHDRSRCDRRMRKEIIAFLRDYGIWDNFPEDLKRNVPKLFAEEIRELDGSTIGEKLDLHYLTFRNRLHFGLAGAVGSVLGKATFFPLASPSLLKAARGLPASEKSMGRVIFDVTRVLCPTMPYLPYSQDPWPDMTTSNYHRPSKYDGEELTLVSARETWEAARRKWASTADRGTSMPKSAVLDRIVDVMPELTEFVRAEAGPAGALLLPDLQRNIIWLRERESKFQRFWYSRTAAMADVLTI